MGSPVFEIWIMKELVPIPKANIYPIKDNLSPEKAAEEYEHQLKQLVANKKLKTSAVTKKKLVTFITDSPKPPPLRISFTFPQINSTSKIAMVVTGEDATDAVKVTLGEHADYGYPLPVQKVKPEAGEEKARALKVALLNMLILVTRHCSVTTDGETRGAIISAMEGQSREAIDAGWTPLCAAIVPNFHLPMHSYEVKNMYLMALLNLSARFCGLRRDKLCSRCYSFLLDLVIILWKKAVLEKEVKTDYGQYHYMHLIWCTVEVELA
ncbi:probable 6-phosphogluconolactonase 4, chloroplastic [Tanacetum coccineum]